MCFKGTFQCVGFFVLMVYLILEPVQLTTSGPPILVPQEEFCAEIRDVNDCGLANYTNTKRGSLPMELCCPNCTCEANCVIRCCLKELYEEMLLMDEPKRDPDMESCYKTSIDKATGDNARYFYMIDKCPEISDKNAENLHCGDEDSYLWGSLLPIFSPTRTIIYKNSACAECHNITDGVIWTVSASTLSTDDPTDMFSYGFFSGGAEVGFKYPGDQKDLDASRCFQPIHACPAEDVRVTIWDRLSNYTKSEVRDMCLNGQQSYVWSLGNVYYNVFCYACNKLLSFSVDCNNGTARTDQATLTWILDTSKIALFEKKGTLQMPVYSECVQHPQYENEEDCYAKICPIGRIPSVNLEGPCEYLTKEWSSVGFIINLTLRPRGTVRFQDFEAITEQISKYGSLPANTMKRSPWGNNWMLVGKMRYSVETVGTETFLTEVILQMKFRFNNVRIDQFTSDIEEALSKPWVLTFQSLEIAFDQAFQPFDMFAEEGSNPTGIGFSFGQVAPELEVPSWASFKDHAMFSATTLDHKTYRHVVHPNMELPQNVQRDALKVTKLFYCSRRELDSFEILILSSHFKTIAIFHISTGRYYFNLEFEEIHSMRKTTFRVCVPNQESGFSSSPASRMDIALAMIQMIAALGYLVIKTNLN